MSPFAAFRRRHGRIERRFRPVERELLATLLREVQGLLGDVDAPGASVDPVLDRLLPETYRDDPLAELEYRTAVRERSALAKSEVLSRIAADVAEADTGPVRLDDEGAVLWLKGLGDLRLAYATRHGADALSGAGRAASVYHWLSWLQSGLVDAVGG